MQDSHSGNSGTLRLHWHLRQLCASDSLRLQNTDWWIERAAIRATPDFSRGNVLAAAVGGQGLVAAAPPEDVFTQDTVTKRMPKILDSVMAKLPSKFQTPAVTEGVKKLQEEMRGGAQLKLLEGRSARVGAEAWNEHLADFLARGEGWHQAPWWLVENYMYKRLLEEGSSLGHVRLSCCFVCAVCCVVHVGCAVVCVRGPCVMLHWVGYIS
ncbi:unnamed protein product [Effrenium voratum]|uniref:Sugar phosphate phosphatase n=1 Tax=Effrenium voratum TaxID=2562239 RepID=A0AA36MV45_9DINO|nr:unnamed protein product [Effrenium voratum]